MEQERSSLLRVTQTGTSTNTNLLCNQLDKLNATIKEKSPALPCRQGIKFNHDNAQPQTAMVILTKPKALK